MKKHTGVRGDNPLTEEHNCNHVYLRYNITQETIREEDGTERTGYVWDEWVLTTNEFSMIRQGILPYNAAWDEVLRGVERGYLYDNADKFCMKYSTYAKDDTKLAQWTQYKADVHNTVSQAGYPKEVVYPTKPAE